MSKIQKLEAAGFRVFAVYKRRYYVVEAANGEKGVVIYQDDARWHWFSKEYEATASGSSIETMMQGGLGDAIDNDRSMAVYKRLVSNTPDFLVSSYAGLRQASIQVFNEGK